MYQAIIHPSFHASKATVTSSFSEMSLPLHAFDLVTATGDDAEGTAQTSLQLKAREHAASIALMHVRNSM